MTQNEMRCLYMKDLINDPVTLPLSSITVDLQPIHAISFSLIQGSACDNQTMRLRGGLWLLVEIREIVVEEIMGGGSEKERERGLRKRK